MTTMSLSGRQEQGAEPEAALTFVLVHGAFQTGDTWEPVAAELRRHGHTVHTPTLAGHGPGAALDLSHDDGVASLVGYLREHDLSDVVLVGHSIAGSFIAKAAEQLPGAIKRLVFQNAFVPADGNPLAMEFPPQMAAMMSAIDPSQGFMLPFPLWRELACNDIDLATVQELYAKMSPIPVGFMADKIDLSAFYELVGTGQIRTSYVFAVNDIVLPPGEYGWFPRMPQRLGPLCRILQTQGGHEAKYTRPAELAEVLVQAGRD
jgi:pimeloyl-ACP methyl ester carboxylesterase